MLFASLTPLHHMQEPLLKGCEFRVGFTDCIVGALLSVVNEFIAFVEAHVVFRVSCKLGTLFALDIIVS